MSIYSENNPVISFRVSKVVKEKLDKWLGTETRQKYLSDLLMEDMKKKNIIKVIIK